MHLATHYLMVCICLGTHCLYCLGTWWFSWLTLLYMACPRWSLFFGWSFCNPAHVIDFQVQQNKELRNPHNSNLFLFFSFFLSFSSFLILSFFLFSLSFFFPFLLVCLPSLPPSFFLSFFPSFFNGNLTQEFALALQVLCHWPIS